VPIRYILPVCFSILPCYQENGLLIWYSAFPPCHLEQSLYFLSSQLKIYENKLCSPELSEITKKKHPLNEFCNQIAEILTITTTKTKANSIQEETASRIPTYCWYCCSCPERNFSDQRKRHGQYLQRQYVRP